MEQISALAQQKSKSQRYENQPAINYTHNSNLEFERSHSHDKPNQQYLIMAYLALQKNLILLTQRCKKLVMKRKRQSIRFIFEFGRENRGQKNSISQSPPQQTNKLKKDSLKIAQEQTQIDAHQKKISSICIQQTLLTLEKLYQYLRNKHLQRLQEGWNQLRSQQYQQGGQIHNNLHRPSLQENETATKTASRLSNKHKPNKSKEDHKQNSQLSGAQLSLQNHRMRNQMLQEEEQRDAFIEQLGDLLEHHEKYLAQGSSTTRTKKHK